MLRDIKCIIIDDEPKAIDLVRQRLGILFPDIQIAGSFTEWEKGLDALKNTAVDILFLDISMPQKSGLDLLKLFPKINFQVIFITAHSNFAVDAIKFSAVGYVLKPIDDYELSFAVNKALERIDASHNTPPPVIASSDNGNNKAIANGSIKIGIPNLKGIDYINSDDILYFESVNKYTKVVTREHSLLSSYNLGEFKKLVENDHFFQVHRSYVINLLRVRRYETSGTVVMEDNMQIPVAKTIRTEFLNIFSTITRTVGLKSRDID
jgi:two-component system LytT family response regulator